MLDYIIIFTTWWPAKKHSSHYTTVDHHQHLVLYTTINIFTTWRQSSHYITCRFTMEHLHCMCHSLQMRLLRRIRCFWERCKPRNCFHLGEVILPLTEQETEDTRTIICGRLQLKSAIHSWHTGIRVTYHPLLFSCTLTEKASCHNLLQSPHMMLCLNTFMASAAQ